MAPHLRALREEDDPLIDLIENDRGLAGDLLPPGVLLLREVQPNVPFEFPR